MRFLGSRFLSSMLVLGAFALIFSSCAYRAGTADRRLPDGAKLIAIPVFKNKTAEAGVEVPFTNAIIRELERSQLARVVPKSEAQVVLDGVISRVGYLSTAPTIDASGMPSGTVFNSEYRILITTKLELRRISDGQVLWTQEISGERSYQAPRIGAEGLNSANALYNHSARYENMNAMAADMMAQAYGRLTENF